MKTPFDVQLKAAGLPQPVTDYRFHKTRRWKYDLAWVNEKVALEIEGGLWKYGRHNRPAGFLRDCEKYNEGTCQGWRIIRVDHKQLGDGTALKWIERLLK